TIAGLLTGNASATPGGVILAPRGIVAAASFGLLSATASLQFITPHGLRAGVQLGLLRAALEPALRSVWQLCLSGEVLLDVLLCGEFLRDVVLIPVTSEVCMARPVVVDVSEFRSGDAFDFVVSPMTWTDDPVVKIYCTIKRNLTDADGAAIVQKTITTTQTASGRITSDGGAGTLEARVIISKLESALILPDKVYHYDLRAITAGGDPAVLYTGRIKMRKTPTDANS
ncbi:MAG TPA: hypothetical protein PLD20_20745, partial [Blastocatellia bacterium]|nr:hypothetical protein [Blastocatellia bacterium]